MDLREHGKRIVLTRKKVNADGSVTLTSKYKKKKRKKVVVASGVGTRNPTVGDVITSQLQPLKPAMVRQLNRRGFNTGSMDFKEVIALYYNEFVSQDNNPASPYVPISSYEFRNHFAFRIHTRDHYNGDFKDFRVGGEFDHVGGIVDNIVSIFRLAKLKKRAAVLEGIPPKDVMTDEEITQANAAEKVEKDLTEKALNSKALKIGTFKNVLIIALVGLLIWQFLK